MFRFLIVFFISLFLNTEESKYVFGWTHLKNPDLQTPRGGTSTGPEVELDLEPNPYWEKLKNPSLSKFEKDRLAILAMQGEHKVNFDFMETVGFVENYVPAKPYQSWGTEFVFLVEERRDFLSLQHIMVMFFEMEDGTISEPMVVKHWRQDWKYQDKNLNKYIGDSTWQKMTIPWSERRGTWSQSVYQVDDSPRYHGYGRWRHFKNSSIWISEETNRPLPRREATVRSDYDIMIGTNIHTITPFGWLHEQNNNKVRVDDVVVAKEIGLARYQRIKNFDWEAGYNYWKETEVFWSEVRAAWAKRIDNSKTLTILSTIDNQPLFAKLFQLADEYKNDGQGAIDRIDVVIDEHIVN